MSWWGAAVLVIAVVIVIRWYQVGRALQAQQPGNQALAEAWYPTRALRDAIDYTMQNPSMSLHDRGLWLTVIDNSEEELSRLMERSIHNGAKLYLQSFARWVPVARDIVCGAPYDLENPNDEERFIAAGRRKNALEAYALNFVEANPGRSFLGSIIRGVPEVRDIPPPRL